MSPTVFALVMLAAMLHASWNAIVKGSGDTVLTTIMVAVSAALVAAALLPLLPPPARASWPFIGTSVLLQIGYFFLVAQAYRAADMSQAYPLMRGTAPLLVALVSSGFLHEPLGPAAWAGIAVICSGILGMALARQRGGSRRGTHYALLNAVVIAAYTLIDGTGARRSGSPAAYTLWIFLLSGVPLAAWALAVHGRGFARFVASRWRAGLIGGVGVTASYGLALWAMTIAPVAVVAALRETSILFGAAISGVILKERLEPSRIAAVCLIAAGAVVLRLA